MEYAAKIAIFLIINRKKVYRQENKPPRYQLIEFVCSKMVYTEVVFPMDYEAYFSERLAKLRIKAGVSARDMSLSMGQNLRYINKIENRQNFPSMSGFLQSATIWASPRKNFLT